MDQWHGWNSLRSDYVNLQRIDKIIIYNIYYVNSSY